MDKLAVDTLLTDLRFAVRTLMKRPALAGIAVASVAIAIGANTAVFSLVNGVLLRPFPLPEPEELIVPKVVSSLGFEITLSIPDFRDWAEQNRAFQSMGANATRSKTLTGRGAAEMIRTETILGDYFETLQVPPFLGRLIRKDETWMGAAPIAVVSYGFWQRRMGGDPDAMGQAVILDAESFVVVGVLPEEFSFPSTNSEVFLPMGFYADRMCWDVRQCSEGTWAIARLRDGVTLEAAQADMNLVVRQIEQAAGVGVASARLETLRHAYVGDVQDQLWLLMVAVALVLVIAGVNLASLLTARGVERRREMAVRLAVGATGSRVVRQLLTESLLLAALGGVLGIGVAWLALELMTLAMIDRVPSALMGQIGLDIEVFTFTAAITVLVGAGFGVVPALRASRTDIGKELREGGGGSTGARIRSGLVVAEVALSVVLLVGAALMVQSLRRLQHVEKGFDAENLLVAQVSLPPLRYGEKELAWTFFETLESLIERHPGVLGVSVANTTPLKGFTWERGIWPEGTPIERGTSRPAQFTMASTDHHAVLGIPLIRGRAFTVADREGSRPVAMVDETMAELFWPGEDPIGKRVTFERAPESTDEHPVRLYREVVGVVAHVRSYALEFPGRVQVYVPMSQSGANWNWSMDLIVKTAGDARQATSLVRRELFALDSEVPLSDIQTLEAYVEYATSGTRLLGVLLSIFGALALVLSAIGLYGIIAFSVTQRVREIGIRLALGADTQQVVGLVARKGFAIAVVGTGIGLIASLGLTRILSEQLFEVSPVEPVTFVGVTLLLLAVSSVAGYLPARRATRVAPARVLRQE